MSFIPAPQPNFNNFQTIDVQNLELKFNNLVNSINATLDTVLISEGGVTKLNPAKVKLTQLGGVTADEITGGMISNALLKGVQDFTFQTADGSPAFSATDYDTVAWQAFTLKFSDGTQYAISAGNTGNVSTTAVSYVYWDKAISLTVLQVTTDFNLTLGADRKLCCVVWGTADTSQAAGYVPAVGVLGINSMNISANSVSAATIQAGAVTAAKINVAQLSAISADLGTVTAGSMTSVLIRTAASGKRFEVNYSTANEASWYNSGGSRVVRIGDTFLSGASGGGIELVDGGIGIDVNADNNGTNYDRIGIACVARKNQSGGLLASPQFTVLGVGGSGYMTGSGTSIGVLASSTGGTNSYGLYGQSTGTATTNYGVYGTAANASTNWAGYFDAGNVKIVNQLNIGIATGTAPLAITSTTVCTNLNADLLDGSNASDFAPSSGANYSNWDTAYTDRMKWDGGSTGLNAATGRTSLGLGTLAVVNVGQTGSFPDGNMNAITVVDGIITAGI